MKRFILDEPNVRKSWKRIEGYIDGNGCFICDSHIPCSDGRYYNLKRHGKIQKIHRYVYEINNDKIPDGLIVRHKCDNDLCVNPDHLEIGTHEDNMNDMVSRGRSAKGERNAKAKLADEQVEQIKCLLDEGISQAKIAEKFGVWQTMISHIKLGKYRTG